MEGSNAPPFMKTLRSNRFKNIVLENNPLYLENIQPLFHYVPLRLHQYTYTQQKHLVHHLDILDHQQKLY